MDKNRGRDPREVARGRKPVSAVKTRRAGVLFRHCGAKRRRREASAAGQDPRRAPGNGPTASEIAGWPARQNKLA